MYVDVKWRPHMPDIRGFHKKPSWTIEVKPTVLKLAGQENDMLT